MANPQSSYKNYQILSAVLLLFLVGSNIAWYISLSQLKSESIDNTRNLKNELADAYGRLDDISKELDEKIKQIESLEGNVDTLLQIKAELEREKQQILNNAGTYKGKYDQLKNKIKGYEELLSKKDQEIIRLKELNGDLVNRITEEQKKRQAYKDSIKQVEKEKNQLKEIVKKASVLEAQNITFTGRVKKFMGGEQEEVGTQFKAKRLQELTISFNFGKNPAAEIGTKTVYMIIKDPDNATVYSINTTGASTFKANGVEKTATASKDVLFANKEEQVTFSFLQNSYSNGVYIVSFYCEGEEIGKKEFIID